MWFGTDEGLNKYNGYKFTVYKHDPGNAASIINNSVFSIREDAEHNLWILTQNGLDKFDRATESFTHCFKGRGWEVSSGIFQDSKKRLWLNSAEGFYLFNPATGSAKWYRNDPDDNNSLSENYVYEITEDNNGQLWIATRNGLNRFNPEKEQFTRYINSPNDANSIGSGFIKTVYKDGRGNIWAGTQGSGIAMFDPIRNSFINYKHDPKNENSLVYNDILSFTEDAVGKLWIGTENGGISIYDYTTRAFTSCRNDEYDPNSLSGNSVYSLYKDNVGNIWAGTWSGGINFLPFFGDKFTHYKKMPGSSNSLSNNLVLSMSSDKNNNIWIGTDGGGLNRFNTFNHNFTSFQQSTPVKNGIYNNFVLTAFPYAPDTLLLGFHRGGIDFFDEKKNAFTHYATKDINTNRLTSLSVLAAYKDRRNNLWLSNDGYGGIFLFDAITKKFIPFLPDANNIKSIASNSVYAMYETRSGQFWIGGDRGIDLFDRDKNEFTHHQASPGNKDSLSDNVVNCIVEDAAGNLWIGTAAGLNYYSIVDNKFTVYTEKDGLPNNTIWAIQQDRHGNLWISTNKGLSNFNIVSKTFRNYTISDGLQSNTFKHKASAQSLNGELYFGGVNGFNSFYPDSIKDNNFIPPVFITGFEVFNKPVRIGADSPLKESINQTKEIKLSYNQSVFTIEFAALNFTHPEQNQYAYKLEGFDKDWDYAGSKRSATYTNLNPGTYTFKVKGSNNDGVWNDKPTLLTIIILPPFWQTWWFRLGGILLIAGSVFAFYRMRLKGIQQQKVLLQQKVNEQTMELVRLNQDERAARLEAEQSKTESEAAREAASKANIALQVKNKELEQFAYVASHDLQEPLRTTVGFVELLQMQYKGKLDEKADKYLNFIADAAKRMRILITDLLEFSRIGTKENVELVDCNIVMKNVLADIMASATEANATISYGTLPVINGYPTEMKLLFQNLLVNAVKFRKKNVAPFIQVTVENHEDNWKFAIIDNGIGIEKEYSERIFDIFQRLNIRTEYQGSGIGLAHCKKIVELHGGKIWMEPAEGGGSKFLFTIPKKVING
nr:two-component regulator propeller domain-containing protein [Ferruginibacter sp.]